MGFNINETFKTELHYKDVAIIAVALGEYQTRYKNVAEPDILLRSKRLVDRLGIEMASCPDDCELDDMQDKLPPMSNELKSKAAKLLYTMSRKQFDLFKEIVSDLSDEAFSRGQESTLID